MPDEPTPTYRGTREGDVTRYTCLIEDAGKPEGICGHWSTDTDLFIQHMQQRHAGVLIPEAGSEPVPEPEPAPEPAPAPEDEPAPPVPPTEPDEEPELIPTTTAQPPPV